MAQDSVNKAAGRGVLSFAERSGRPSDLEMVSLHVLTPPPLKYAPPRAPPTDPVQWNMADRTQYGLFFPRTSYFNTARWSKPVRPPSPISGLLSSHPTLGFPFEQLRHAGGVYNSGRWSANLDSFLPAPPQCLPSTTYPPAAPRVTRKLCSLESVTTAP